MSFCCGPFLLVPRVIGFSNLFCCRPRVCKVCFFVAPRWAPRPFGGARTKKKAHHPGCVFFAPAPRRKAGQRRSPVGRRHGARAKKKNTTQGVFFLLWPRAGAQRGFSFPCLSPGPEQKKTWVVCFFLWPRRKVAAPNGAQQKKHFAHPGTTAKKNLETNDTGHEQKGATKKKKKLLTPGPRCSLTSFPGRLFRVVFLFSLRPRADAHSPTAVLGGDASRRGGVLFLLRPRPDRGGVFLFCCGPARTLTHSLWAGAISARPWCFFFFWLRPRRTRRANNKKCLVYYIGSKKTRRGHSKKNTTSEAVEEGSPEFGVWEREGKRLSWLCFVCSFLASTAEFIVQFLRRFKLPA